MKEYVNGSDLLVSVAGKAVGHCTTHTATFSSETKELAMKPLASEAPSSNALYKSKRVTGLTVQVKAEGLQFYNESESGFKQVLGPWSKGQSVVLNLFERSQDTKPYVTGSFVITSIEQTAAAAEDASYAVTFDNDGAPTVDTENLDLNADTEQA